MWFFVCNCVCGHLCSCVRVFVGARVCICMNTRVLLCVFISVHACVCVDVFCVCFCPCIFWGVTSCNLCNLCSHPQPLQCSEPNHWTAREVRMHMYFCMYGHTRAFVLVFVCYCMCSQMCVCVGREALMLQVSQRPKLHIRGSRA